jgi:type IV pilus assembly protein PilY1
MKRRTLALVCLLIAGAAMLAVGDVLAAACDIPLFIRRTISSAKVLIIFDTSASMNEAMWHSAYNPSVAYSGNFTRTNTYSVSSDGFRSRRSFNSSWPSTPTAYLVNSDQGEQGDYLGNYLNWVYSHATAAQRAAIPRFTRIQMAKSAVDALLARGDPTEYGLMIFNDDDGGTLLSPIGTSVTTLRSQVASLRGDDWTPLAETMVDALDYFSLSDGTGPVTASCEKCFIILATDGHPTQDLDVPGYIGDYDNDGREPGSCSTLGAPFPNSYDCSEYLDDVAMYMYANDLRPDIDDVQNVTTYVIGMNINAWILPEAAADGGGQYFAVNNAAELGDALIAALNAIMTKVSSGTSVSVVSAENLSNNRMYRAKFESVSWRGFLDAFDLPYSTGDTPVWQAGELLQSRTADSRQIYTSSTGTNKLAFTSANVTTLATTTLLGTTDTAVATEIIDYARGNDVAGYRDRAGWKLGDIVDSSPIAVGKPSHFYDFLSYSSFQSANASRPEVVYVGANEGMMHCFNASDGTEEWAYIPKNQLSRLQQLMSPAYCHSYFVNAAPAVYDIYVNSAWKTILVGGQQRGGSGLFALDVTDPTVSGMDVIWDLDIPELKGSWSRPELVRDPITDAFVLCVGTGLDSLGGQGNLLVIDPANGSILDTHALGSPVAMNMVTAFTALDKDFDNYDDLLYAGDLAGRVWRVDLTTNPWTVTQLFDGNLPIQAAPILTMDELGRVLVFFGTGQYLTDGDVSTTGTQSFYGVFDDHSGTLVTRSMLVDQTSSFTQMTSTDRGWYMDLVQASGERVTRQAALIAGTLYFPSFRPKNEVCQGGGESWFYAVDYYDGSAPDNDDGSDNDTVADRVDSKGDGILSDPSVDLVNEDIILQSSDTSVLTEDTQGTIRRIVIRSWRQLFD